MPTRLTPWPPQSASILTGGRIHADIKDSSAQLERKQSEYADLVGRVDYEIRNAFTDLGAADVTRTREAIFLNQECSSL